MFDPKQHQAIAEALHHAICRRPGSPVPGAGTVVAALVHLFADDSTDFDAYAFVRAVKGEEA